ncbi:MAG: amidohydrolase [Anaerolineaceae bacterium]
MLVLHNGIIRTIYAPQPLSEALAIQDGRIIAVGTNENILNLAGRDSESIDLHGYCILPGFTDAHIHLLQYGLKLSSIDCETESKNECLRRVSTAAQHAPAEVWIRGQGWNHNLWEEGIGTKKELDAISKNHPIYLAAKSLHASWVNSAALTLAGIDRNTPDPLGGKIERDAHGEPTGILLESASLLVEKMIPQPNDIQIKTALLKGQEQLLRFGITAVHDMDEWKIYPLLEKMKENAGFPLRVVKSIPADHLQDAIHEGLFTGMGNESLRIGWLKLFMDGALGPQTAAMLAPYEGSADKLGMLVLSTHNLVEIGDLAARNGISLAIHAIGDKAIRCALDGIEKIFPRTALSNRIEHVQIIDPADLQRMADLHLVASMQPIHVISDMEIADKYWGKRCEYAYAWNSIHSAGIPLVFGSDAPVESPNPFLGIHAAVTRQNSKTKEAWYPQQALSLQTALEAYISTPASLLQNPASLGKLSAGSLADLMILNEDPFTIPTLSLRDLSPLATMIAGEFVWKSSDFPQ